MKDYSFYIIIAYSFCFLSLIILTILSKVFLSDSKKRALFFESERNTFDRIVKIIRLKKQKE